MYAHCIWASHNDKTPLLCAAEAGHDEIVEYLLEFDEVQADLKNKKEKVDNASVSKSMQWAASGRVCNYVKFETAVKFCQPWLTRLA